MKKTGARRQEEIIDFIKERILDSGSPPSLREIRDRFSYSSLASPRYHLRVLAEQGRIKLNGAVSRGIELLEPVFAIPVLGRISAGLPLDCEENIEGYLDMVNAFSRKRPLFCLRVQGDSMEGAGIVEDDLVIVRKQAEAEPGQIVAAIIEGEALLKRLKGSRSEGYKLAAENPKYTDIPLNDGMIIGKAVGVLRNYEPVRLY